MVGVRDDDLSEKLQAISDELEIGLDGMAEGRQGPGSELPFGKE